ncbi:DUF3784 domain-containing protein [Candidatus Enterococcus clewellii]|uniref:DUF3784 domain-containing protein n=1 Tax=Candidatus Enterococcus clewellii TaxID=1834193 RepID=A0A242KCR9_9ENTE|nr:DUF3784 domain-containing protein [Enterococcus sp. 9E7_DIV0242]OTP18756.1 hypothetical protein A5888_000570 [Enterococcus sp. 9E7_DIV0242]
MNSDLTVQLGVALIMIIFGIQLLRGKWLMLIAGYNTMGAEKRRSVNGEALGRAVGILLLYVSLLSILLIWVPIINDLFGWLIIIPTGFLLVYTNFSPRFKK